MTQEQAPTAAAAEVAIAVTPPAPLYLGSSNLGEFKRLPSFTIRNGDPRKVRSLLVRLTISPAYHWVPIEGMQPGLAMASIDAYIKCHVARMETSPPAGLTSAQARKAGIALGVARAVSTARYNLGPQDFIPEELATPMMTATVTPGPPQTASISLRDGLEEGLARRLSEATNYTEVERAAIASLVMCSIGLIPLQGYSLMMTNHHYERDPSSQSRKAYALVERQFWKGKDVATWFSDDITVIQDVLWHKATHPVNITVKITMATDPRVANMVKMAGAGSVAARLPAVEPELRAANVYKKLLSTVAPLFATFGGFVDFDALIYTMDVVEYFAPNSTVTGRPDNARATKPDYVVSRPTALKWLGEVLERNSSIVAFCYGFYTARAEANKMLSGAQRCDTLLSSYALNKLKSHSFAAYVSGQLAFGDYTAAKAAKRQEGWYSVPQFKLE